MTSGNITLYYIREETDCSHADIIMCNAAFRDGLAMVSNTFVWVTPYPSFLRITLNYV